MARGARFGILSQRFAERLSAEAAAVFLAAMQHTSSPEMLFGYASFLASQGRKEEAREWLGRLEEKRRTAPRFMQRVERPWFKKGMALLKELSAPRSTSCACSWRSASSPPTPGGSERGLFQGEGPLRGRRSNGTARPAPRTHSSRTPRRRPIGAWAAKRRGARSCGALSRIPYN